MSEDGNNDGDNGRRPPRDMKGLLKFCMEATRSEDAPEASHHQAMSEERRQWLEEALTDMSVSPVERMSVCVRAIMAAEVDTEAGTEAQVKAVSELQDWADDLDIALDFIKIQGLCIVPPLLSSEVSELRWRCLELLATLAQNNPEVQQELLSLRLMPALLALITEDPNPTVQVKALYAVSCLVRNHDASVLEFVREGGVSALLTSVSSGEERLVIKSAFLMATLCGSSTEIKDRLTQEGAVRHLVHQLKDTEHSPTHEHLAGALLKLVTDNAAARTYCLQEELDLKTFLCARIRQLQGQEEFQEERESADRILNILNTEPTESAPTERPQSMAVMPV